MTPGTLGGYVLKSNARARISVLVGVRARGDGRFVWELDRGGAHGPIGPCDVQTYVWWKHGDIRQA